MTALCSPASQLSVMTLSSTPEQAPSFSVTTASDSTTFRSTLTVTFNASNLEILRLNGLVRAYGALLTRSDGTTEMATTSDLSHTNGDAAPSGSSVTFMNLFPNTVYNIQSRVLTSGSNGVMHEGPYSTSENHTTAETRPQMSFSGTPTISNIQSDRFTINFNEPAMEFQHGSITQYVIHYRRTTVQGVASTAEAMVTVQLSGTMTMISRVLSVLEPSSEYYTTVQACTAVGCSDEMLAANATTLTAGMLKAVDLFFSVTALVEKDCSCKINLSAIVPRYINSILHCRIC